MQGVTGFVISIHAPRTGSDNNHSIDAVRYALFQSTLPARGATADGFRTVIVDDGISIHAPRTGSD